MKGVVIKLVREGSERKEIKSNKNSRRVIVNMQLSEFEIPPIWDALLITKKAPIGMEAVRTMLEVVSPKQYKVIAVKHDIFEAIAVKEIDIKMLSLEKLVSMLLEEGERLADENALIKVKLDVIVNVTKEISL
ncbi:hypothetical protein M1N11_04810 [Peptococcaceae bacterium]|nr:hypothetical protein [Peptococcaceae bacterium]